MDRLRVASVVAPTGLAAAERREIKHASTIWTRPRACGRSDDDGSVLTVLDLGHRNEPAGEHDVEIRGH